MTANSVFLLLFLQIMLGYSQAQDATVGFSIREGLPNNTVIGSVALKSQLFEDMSNERFQQLRFQILTNTGNRYAQLFTIEQNTSMLWTKTVLDRESFSECDLECTLDFNVAVYDIAGIDSPKLIQVLVELLDVNDFVPTFDTKNVTLGVDESLVAGTEILTSAAEDLDKGKNNSIQTYRIIPNTEYFELETFDNAGYKEFVLKLKSSLDRETVNFHEFYVLAIDGGNPKLTGTLTVYIHVLDSNDNFPNFVQDSYSSVIDENISVNSTVALVYAKDLDSGENGKVSYKFKDNIADKVNHLFHINDTTGELTVAGVIDFEEHQEVNFTVQAFDHGSPSKTADVEVHVKIVDQNDNYPQVNVNHPPGGYLLPETSENGTFVAHMAVTDADSGNFGSVTCRVLDDHFRLETVRMKDNYKIVVNKALDHETHTSHVVNVTCMDGGSPPKQNSTKFIVHVDDQNDNKPTFTQAIYRASIEENNNIGATVVGVMATDLDSGKYGQVRYAIHEEVKHLFIMDPFTGVITANVTLDREKHGPELVFRILAFDQGDPQQNATGSVVLKILDQNDNDPIFMADPIQFYIEENEPKGTQLGNISVSDPDNGANGTVVLEFPTDPEILENFSFDLLEENFVTVVQEKPLDRDVKAFHEFAIKAIDLGGRTSTAVVIVYVNDINDNYPIIVYPRPPDNQRFVPHSLEKDSLVFTVDARDADIGTNAELIYEIEQDNSSYSFNIDRKTGQVFMNSTLKQKDIGSVFGLVIRVTDKGNPPLSTRETISLHIVEGDMKLATASSQLNLWIVIVLVVITLVLSAIMIIGIIKICCINRNKYGSNSSDIVIESGKMDSKLIDSSSSSASSSSSKDSDRFDKSLGTSLKGHLDENGSLHNSTLSSIDRQIGDEVYLQQVRGFGYDISKKTDETNSDNSGEMGTRDSGQGGSDVDLNSLSELPVLDVHDQSSQENSSVLTPCYHGNLAPSDLSHSVVLSPSNLVQSPDSSHSNSTSDTLYAPRPVTNFSSFKTAERKELSKIRRVPKRVMFSDDLENSQSSGRSSTMSCSFSDSNHVNNSSHRPSSVDLDTDNSRSRPQGNDHRLSVDNLSYHGNHVLPGYHNQTENNNSHSALNFNRNTNKHSSFSNSHSYTLELRKSLSSPDESTYTTTTSGSYSLTLDEVSSSPTDDVFVRDLFV